jgi:hypothetical protein
MHTSCDMSEDDTIVGPYGARFLYGENLTRHPNDLARQLRKQRAPPPRNPQRPACGPLPRGGAHVMATEFPQHICGGFKEIVFAAWATNEMAGTSSGRS